MPTTHALAQRFQRILHVWRAPGELDGAPILACSVLPRWVHGAVEFEAHVRRHLMRRARISLHVDGAIGTTVAHDQIIAAKCGAGCIVTDSQPQKTQAVHKARKPGISAAHTAAGHTAYLRSPLAENTNMRCTGL
eukprot:5069173-Pleurochrysis_carterae.AAC.1